MTKESGAKAGALRARNRNAVAMMALAAGCLAPATLGHIDLVQRPVGARLAVDIPLPPENTFVFDLGDDRHADFSRSASLQPDSRPERPQPLDATAAIETAAPRAVRRTSLDPPLVSAYARAVDPAYPTGVVDPAAGLGVDLTSLREGLEAYKKGDLAKGDAAAAQAKDPLVSTALEWTALRHNPVESGWKRLAKFTADHPDWPMNDWLRRNAEEALYAANPPPQKVVQFFADREPSSPLGRFALARALLAQEQNDRANALARKIWREDNLTNGQETIFLKLFGAALTSADSKYRSDRLLYKEQNAAALRAGARESGGRA